ncbi:1204_t:CDS:1 [Gigaspora margarita]|uniref:1204_t:CDS:1 n=1 Tax=Gigaspora margarita TaxID=4874 RepID=A0ABN7VBN0_GIGMA|nr:1204_t:CDS:1 [Gigaspora margarita]
MSEEDLLRLQEEFFAKNTRPAATVRAQRFNLDLEENVREHEPISKKVLDLRSHTTGIVRGVTENISNGPVIAPSFPNVSAPIDGFPQPVHRNHRSLFRQKKRQALETNENVKSGDSNVYGNQKNEGSKQNISSSTKLNIDHQDLSPKTFESEDSMLLEMKKKFYPDTPIEYEKLEWMGVDFKNDKAQSSCEPQKRDHDPSVTTPLDPPEASYRFDFNGKIIDKNSTVPSYIGLHHHGAEPDRAGYTLDELLHLMRSVVPSQRTIPLNVIGRIIRKVRAGYYGVETGRRIIDWAIKLKLPTYLRIALDDKFETVIIAAIDTISAWIIGGPKEFYQEEKLWEKVGRLYRGCEFVSLGVRNDAQTKKYFGIEISAYEAEEEYDTMETHVKLASKDLIAGLISMDITHRLLYLLESVRLPRVTNEQILLMLVRFARHSRKTAKIIFECHRLLDVVHNKFLCVAWPPANNDDSLNESRYPNLAAAKLIHILCQSSKKISKEIINRYMNTFLRYIAINPASFSNEFEMTIGYNFFQETLCIYQTLAAYGLYHEIFSQTYCIVNWYLVREILYSLTPPWEWKNSDNYQMQQKLGIATSFFRLLEIWIRVQDTESGNIKECGAQPSEIIRDSVDFLANWMNTFSFSLLSQNIDIHEDYEKTLNLISSVTRYIATWCKYLGEHHLKDISEIQRIWEKLCLACWPSSHLCNYLQYQLTNQIQNTQKLSRDEIWQISNLSGAYHSSTYKYISETLSISIICDTYLSYVSLIYQTCQLLSNDNSFSLKALEMIKSSIPIEPLQLYAVKNSVKGDWIDFFNRMHTYLLYEWMIAISMLIDNIGTNEIKFQNLTSLLHDALIIMPNILPGDEKMALDVLGRIVNGISSKSPDTAMRECINILISFYERLIVINNNDNRDNYTLLWDYGASDGLPLLKNWIWTPIDILYSNKSDLVMDAEVRIEIVRNCLTLVCEVMKICKNITNSLTAKFIMDPITMIISIMKIFMLDGEIYRVPDIEQRIEKIISSFTFQQSSANNTKLIKQLLEDTAGVLAVPFYQFFTDFSAAYAAGSYGNKSFARLLLLPISSIYPVDFKHLVWSDLHDILGTIGIEYKDVICLEPLNSYFWPLESNTTLLQAYVGAVIHCKVTREKAPFMYWLAIHHLNGYVFFKDWEVNENDHQKRVDISNAIIKSKKSIVINDWIKYTSRNFGEEVGELVKMPHCFMDVKEEVQHRIEIIKTFNIEFDEEIF